MSRIWFVFALFAVSPIFLIGGSCSTEFWMSSYYCSLIGTCSSCSADSLCNWCLMSNGTEACVLKTDSVVCWANDTCTVPYEFCGRYTDCTTCKNNGKCSWLRIGCLPTDMANLSDPNLDDCAADLSNVADYHIGERRIAAIASGKVNATEFVILETSNSSRLVGDSVDASITMLTYSRLPAFTSGSYEGVGLEFEQVYARKNYSVDELSTIASGNFISPNTSTYTVSFSVPCLIEYTAGQASFYNGSSTAPLVKENPIWFDETQPVVEVSGDGSRVISFTDTSGMITVNYTLIIEEEIQQGAFTLTPYASKVDIGIDMAAYSWAHAQNSRIAVPILVKSNNTKISTSSLHMPSGSTGVNIDDGAITLRFSDTIAGTGSESGNSYNVELFIEPYTLNNAGPLTYAAVAYFSVVDSFSSASNPLLWDPLLGVSKSVVDTKLFETTSSATTQSSSAQSSESAPIYSASDETIVDKFFKHLPFLVFILIAIVICAIIASIFITAVAVLRRVQLKKERKNIVMLTDEDIEDYAGVPLGEDSETDDEEARLEDDGSSGSDIGMAPRDTGEMRMDEEPLPPMPILDITDGNFGTPPSYLAY